MTHSTRRTSRPIEKRGKRLAFPERVNPAHTALIVIDMQNDFCHVNGVIGSQGHDLAAMAPMAAKLRMLIAEARERGVLTIFVRGHEDGRYLNDPMAETYHGRKFDNGLVLSGSWGADWYANIKPVGAPNEIEFIKHRFSAFEDSPLDLYLRSNGIRTIVATGVVTSGCVDCSVRDGFSLGYHCVIPADCVADASPERHTASLEKLAQAFGNVVSSEEIIEVWRSKNSAAKNWEPDRKRARRLRDLSTMIAPPHAALILVGLQRNEGAPAVPTVDARAESEAGIVPAIETLLAAARKAGVLVLHVLADRHPLSRSEVANEGEPSLLQDPMPQAAATAFLGATGPSKGEELVISHRTGAFADTKLDLLLRTSAVRTIVIAGIGLTGVIESTARAASDRDYYVVIPSDAVANRDGEAGMATHSLAVLGKHFGRVVSSAEILATWNAAASEHSRQAR